jgi:hypothetical protein
MLIGMMGKMGAGKTLSMSTLATFLHKQTGAPLYANYQLEGAQKIESFNDLMKVDTAIFCFDEMWLSMDARQWKDNVRLTQWINQTRKKKLIILYTTQHIRQIELRARNATDILVYCEKTPQGHWLTFVDWAYKTIGRRYLIPHEAAQKFYHLYDTFEVLKPLEWTAKKPWAPQKQGGGAYSNWKKGAKRH